MKKLLGRSVQKGHRYQILERKIISEFSTKTLQDHQHYNNLGQAGAI